LRARLAERIGQERYALWFGSQTRFRFTDGKLVVVASCNFTRDWLRRNFADELGEVGGLVLGGEVGVEFDVDDALEPAHVPSVEHPSSSVNGHATAEPAQLVLSRPKRAGSRPRQPTVARHEPSLTDLIVGASNEYAVRAAEVTARGLQQASPVTFCGVTGVGKTHLLRAIRAEYRHTHPRARAVYLSAEQFTTGFVEALRGTGLPSFRQKCRGADLLVVDDVQFFIGKRASLDELTHTIDTLLADGRQIVFASDRMIGELQPLGKELVSRLASGLICNLQLPDFAMRREIVRRFAREMRVELDDGVGDLVATQIHGGARELRGALHRLHATSLAYEQPVTVTMATSALADLAQQCTRHVRLADVEQAICRVFGVEAEALRSERKARSIQEPRMLGMWLARKYTRAPWSEIGEFFGRRSHSTVISAHRRVEQLIRSRAEIGVSHGTCDVEEAIRRVEAALRTA
jgi:chromosomal replication initiator protein